MTSKPVNVLTLCMLEYWRLDESKSGNLDLLYRLVNAIFELPLFKKGWQEIEETSIAFISQNPNLIKEVIGENSYLLSDILNNPFMGYEIGSFPIYSHWKEEYFPYSIQIISQESFLNLILNQSNIIGPLNLIDEVVVHRSNLFKMSFVSLSLVFLKKKRGVMIFEKIKLSPEYNMKAASISGKGWLINSHRDKEHIYLKSQGNKWTIDQRIPIEIPPFGENLRAYY
jgi:hypothetical protein